MQKEPPPTEHLSPEAKDTRWKRWTGVEAWLSTTWIHILYYLLFHQESHILTRGPVGAICHNIYKYYHLQMHLPLIFSVSEISDTATLTYSQMYEEQIFVT